MMNPAITTVAATEFVTDAHSRLFSAIVPAPFGYIGVRTEAGVIIELVYLPERFTAKAAQDQLAEQAEQQIAAYFQDPQFQFSLNLKPVGTLFQQRVWAAIAAIPCGQVLSYGQVAKHLKTAPRAVGQACGANPYPLIVPCHRVTAASGIGGFAHHDDASGFHVGVKRSLLLHEKVAGLYEQGRFAL